MQKIANWFRSNKMAVNATKTKYIIFRTQGKRINPLDCVVLFNNNELNQPDDPEQIFQIERIHNEGETKNFKLLGVLFDEYLSFDDHINNLCAKISKSLFCINRIKNFVRTEALKMLYFAMIHSHIMYCMNVYSCANKTFLNKLVIKQKQAIRIISQAGYRDHTAPLFAQLGILPIDHLMRFAKAKFMHQFISKKLPITFAETWLTNRERTPNNRELRNANDLYIPSHNFATLKRMPLFSFPKAWNEELDSKNLPSQNLFLKSLKRSLLQTLL